MIRGLRDENDGVERGRVDGGFIEQAGGRIGAQIHGGHAVGGDPAFTQAHRLGEAGELRRILASGEALGLKIPDDGADRDSEAGEAYVGE